MSTHFACPNPACTQVFAAEQLAGLTAFTCPGCRMTFYLQGAAPPPPPPSYPPTGGYVPPPASQPYAQPGYAPPAYAHPGQGQPRYPQSGYGAVVAPASGETWASGQTQADPTTTAQQPVEEPAPRRRQGQGRDMATVVMVAFLTIGLMTALIVGGYMQMRHMFSKDPPLYESKEFGYSFQPPSTREWTRDDSLRVLIDQGALTYVRRGKNKAWFALACRDLRGRPTTEDELLQVAETRLKNYFPDRFDYEHKADGGQIDGRPARRMDFEALDDTGAEVRGSVYAVLTDSAGFIFYTWALAGNYAKSEPELTALRNRIKFIKRKATGEGNYTDIPGNGYTLRSLDNLWQEQPGEPKDYDPNCDLALLAKDRTDKKDNSRWAFCKVLKIPGDGMEAARQYIIEKLKKEFEMEVKLDEMPLKTKPRGRFSGQIAAFKETVGDGGRESFIVLGVLPQGGETLVIWLECQFRRRATYEGEFVRMIESYQPGGSRPPKSDPVMSE